MKQLIQFIFPTVKAVVTVTGFLIGIGWGAYGMVYVIVKAEGQEIRREVRVIRDVDMGHLDKRFDRIEKLIKEQK